MQNIFKRIGRFATVCVELWQQSLYEECKPKEVEPTRDKKPIPESTAQSRALNQLEQCPFARNDEGTCRLAHITANGKHLCFYSGEAKRLSANDANESCAMFDQKQKAVKARRYYVKKELEQMEAKPLLEGDEGTRFA